MPGPLFTNNATGTLAGSYSAAATALTLTGGQGNLFPSPTGGDWFMATIVNPSNVIEIVKCTSRNVDTLTVVRGQEGTAARALVAGEKVENRLTAGSLMIIRNTPVDPNSLPDGSVPGSKIAPSSITGAQIVDGSISGADIGNGQIGPGHLQAGVAVANLGFTPVQQSGGANQGANKIYIGWTGFGKVGIQVDATDEGLLLMERNDGTPDTAGYRALPLTPINNNYTFGVSDNGKCVVHSAGGHAYSVPDDNTPLQAGTTIQILNRGGVLNIVPQGTVIMVWMQTGRAGACALAAPGICTVLKASPNEWYIFGQGLS